MRKIIHHIRKQPEETRRHILHVSTIAFAIILFLLWVYSIGTTFTNQDTQTKISQDLKPFSALKDNIVEGYNNLSKSNSNITQ
jgi:amino acid transporter